MSDRICQRAFWKTTEALRDKVKGMFLGIAIGDALGMPVEFVDLAEKDRRFGRVTSYLRPDGHKWFDGRNAGEWTDDWLYSSIVAESLIARGCIDLDDLAERHAESFRDGSYLRGAGRSTRYAIKQLAQGVHWSKSGMPGSSGNGVAMKIAPIGAYLLAAGKSEDEKGFDMLRMITGLAVMTHGSRMAATSAIMQAFAVMNCLVWPFDEEFRTIDIFRFSIPIGIAGGKMIKTDEAAENQDYASFEERLLEDRTELSVREMASRLGPDKASVYFTMPFCFSAFSKNPRSIETLYDVVNAGGDTDTNGSIVGALLGAYNGARIFPAHLIEGLWRKNEIIDLAQRFCDRFFPLK